MAELDLYDFTNSGVSIIQHWVTSNRFSSRTRARLNQKLDRLVQMDFQLAVGTRLLAGPISGNVYKLRIFADVMLRPLLCKGPLHMADEYTLLQGAIEDGRDLDPPDCIQRAEQHREIVRFDPKRRMLHETLK